MPEADGGTSRNNGTFTVGAAAGAGAWPNAGRILASPATMPHRRNPRLEKVITPILFVLARVGFVRLYYPDAMIGEFEVRSRQVKLRHMAGHAVAFGYWASLCS